MNSTTDELQLEVGKTYLSRSGEAIKIIRYDHEFPMFPYLSSAAAYMPDGRLLPAGSEYDLISELSSDLIYEVTNKEALKNDKNYIEKPPHALISGIFLDELAKVLGFGANKYEAYNWTQGHKSSQLVSAISRHLYQFNQGEDIDSESNLSHLAHAACGLMFLLHTQKSGTLKDDRHKVVLNDGNTNS